MQHVEVTYFGLNLPYLMFDYDMNWSLLWCVEISLVYVLHIFWLKMKSVNHHITGPLCQELVISPHNWAVMQKVPDSKVHGANMEPTWVLSAPCWPHEPCYQGCFHVMTLSWLCQKHTHMSRSCTRLILCHHCIMLASCLYVTIV